MNDYITGLLVAIVSFLVVCSPLSMQFLGLSGLLLGWYTAVIIWLALLQSDDVYTFTSITDNV